MPVTSEQWKPVAGWPGFEVSDVGNVRRDNAPIAISLNSYGKRTINLSRRGKRGRESTTGIVDRLVGAAFCPDYLPGLRPRHRDGNKANSSAANLEWITRSEVCAGAYISKPPLDAQARDELCACALTAREAAEKYKISLSTVYRERSRQNRKHDGC